MRFAILTDIFDPSRGSEFQVAQKAIKAAVSHTSARVDVWTLRRAGNESAIGAWLQEHGLSPLVRLRLVEMTWADEWGHHRSKFHFLCDLLRLWLTCLRETRSYDLLWRCGQVNFLFNLPFLALRRRLVVGPVSGFEYPPVGAIALSGDLRLAAKYLVYAFVIAGGRVLGRLALRARSRGRPIDILLATGTDMSVFRDWSSSVGAPAFYRYCEIDLDDLLNRIEPSGDAGPDPGAPYVLWAGEFGRRKNPLLGVQTLRLFLSTHASMRAAVIGDGPLLPVAMKSGQAEDRLRFVPAMQRIDFLRVLRGARALLVTSWREVNSVLVFEALAANVRILALRVSGMADTVPHGGVTVPPGPLARADRLAAALGELVASECACEGRVFLERIRDAEIISEMRFLGDRP